MELTLRKGKVERGKVKGEGGKGKGVGWEGKGEGMGMRDGLSRMLETIL